MERKKLKNPSLSPNPKHDNFSVSKLHTSCRRKCSNKKCLTDIFHQAIKKVNKKIL